MQEELIDIEDLNIKGELIGMENESFDDKTAFVFDEENTTEIINKIKSLIGLDNTQNLVVNAIKEVIENINSTIENIQSKDTTQDNSLTSLENSLNTLNTLVGTIQTENITQDQTITEINNLLDALSKKMTTAEGKIATLENALENIPSDVTDFSDYVTNLQKTLGVYENTYSNVKTYSVGAIEVHNHKVYECITAITTAEEFDESKWNLVPLLIEESEENI